MSKTSDAAGLALALLLTQAPPGSRSYAYAVDREQAALLADAIHGFIVRSGLSGLVEVGASVVAVRSTGATLRIESSDGASAYGTRPWLTVADELGAWPSTTNHRRLWSAVVSAVPKVAGSRLLVLSTAGSPSGLGAQVWREAKASPYWRTSVHPGPSPWWPASRVEALRSSLTASEWARLIECRWVEGDDSLSTEGDVAACVRAGSSVLGWSRSAGGYVCALDVGTRRDLTAAAVGHLEQRAVGRTVVIDRVMYWRPARSVVGADAGNRVDLAEVERSVLRLCREYRVSKIRYDRMQAEQLSANLARAGVRTEEYIFSTAGANRVARSLYAALRDHAVELPDDEELITELGSVRMVETGPGTVKMINPPGSHDDLAVAVGMVIAELTATPDYGGGSVSVPGRRSPRLPRSAYSDAKPQAPIGLRLRLADRAGPRGSIMVGGSANDPTRAAGDGASWRH